MILSAYLKHFLIIQLKVSDNRLNIEEHNLLRTDFPGNKKRGVVCMYYKDHWPL